MTRTEGRWGMVRWADGDRRIIHDCAELVLVKRRDAEGAEQTRRDQRDQVALGQVEGNPAIGSRVLRLRGWSRVVDTVISPSSAPSASPRLTGYDRRRAAVCIRSNPPLALLRVSSASSASPRLTGPGRLIVQSGTDIIYDCGELRSRLNAETQRAQRKRGERSGIGWPWGGSKGNQASGAVYCGGAGGPES